MALLAEAARQGRAAHPLSGPVKRPFDADDFDVIEDFHSEASGTVLTTVPVAVSTVSIAQPTSMERARRHIGISQVTQGNIDNHHIYLRGFFERFPADAVGGSNKAEAALREISVDWGGETVFMTDLDGTKKLFRKRSWIRSFFERNGIMAGDLVSVDMTAPFSYRVSLVRGPRPSA